MTKILITLSLLTSSATSFAAINHETTCLGGDRRACEAYLREFNRTQDYKGFSAAYTKVCASKTLKMTCEELKGTGDDMMKHAAKDPDGAFYVFVKEKPGVIFHVTPLR